MTTRIHPVRAFLYAITRNSISLCGSALTSAAAILFISFFIGESIGLRGGPYLGILIFVIFPALFVFGLALIPIGIVWQRRRVRRATARGEEAGALPIIDLNRGRTRTLLLVFLAATLVNVVIIAISTYKAVEVMDSTSFCGQSCHSVMAPEYTTYRRSPHSRVACVSCHIGPGAGWFVKSKLSGSWQLISVNLNLYPRPIPTPVHSLRPARDTCEQCHWPDKFVGDRLKVITHFQDDEANTALKTVLLLRVGGMQGRASKGIHWHVDPGVSIRYLADDKRETIGTVELTRPDGTTTTYKTPDAPSGGAWRTMDCVDCHNRPTHIYRTPEEEIDHSMAEGRIDPALPFVHREGLKALTAQYASQDEAKTKINEALEAFYGKEHPGADPAKVAAAARELNEIYSTNVFPSMNIKWGTYPSHLGHVNSPGCFRCHDGEHANAGGAVIPQDCDTCHNALAIDEANPEILKTMQP
jgi:hypothetical protein